MTDNAERQTEEQRRIAQQERFYDPQRLREQRLARRGPERGGGGWSPLKIGLVGAAAAGAFLFIRQLPDLRRYMRFSRMS